MWDLPGPGIEPVSAALAGGFLTTAPPGKSQKCNISCVSVLQSKCTLWPKVGPLWAVGLSVPWPLWALSYSSSLREEISGAYNCLSPSLMLSPWLQLQGQNLNPGAQRGAQFLTQIWSLLLNPQVPGPGCFGYKERHWSHIISSGVKRLDSALLSL